MCSEGVSVWFACKTCKSFFLNADDFAYHKKKYHVQEFRNTKFIVFEEQTTPPASPPENWVSFLSPKEETQIHKSSSLSSTPPITDVGHRDPSNEKILNIQNQELIEIDHKNPNDGNDDVGEVSNNTFELNYVLNSNADDEKSVVVQENQLLQSIIAPTSTDSDMTDEKRSKHWSPPLIKSRLRSKTNSLKRSNKKIRNVPSKKALLQTEIQSPKNPYVSLKRLSLKTVQNASSHSNNTAHSQKNDSLNKCRNSADANKVNKPKITGADQRKSNRTNPAISCPPMTTFQDCKFCSEHFNSAEELNFHLEICSLKRQFENIVCVPCQLIFSSSDELDAHNQTIHSTSISTPTPGTTKVHSTNLVDGVEITSNTEIQSDFVPRFSNNSSVTDFPLSINHGDHVYKTDPISDFDYAHDPASNDDNFNWIPDPTTEVNLNYGNLLEVVKIEYEPGENEDSEFPGVDHDPLESESHDETLAEETFVTADSPSNNLDETQASQKGLFYCVSCKKHFGRGREIKEHNKKTHDTPDGKRRFKCPHQNCESTCNSHYYLKVHLKLIHSNANKRSHLKLRGMDERKTKFECPYPNCGKRARTTWHLKSHIQQIHSNDRPFKCPIPNCARSFKLSGGMNRHFKRHTKWLETT